MSSRVYKDDLLDDEFEILLSWVDHMTETQLLRMQCKLEMVQGLRGPAPEPTDRIFEQDTVEILLPSDVTMETDEP